MITNISFKMEKVKELIKLGDFFNSFQMLRINKETEYRTYTGGIVSIGVIVTIAIAFASMIRETLNRTIIDYTFNQQKGQDPPLTILKASPQQNFMFALEVTGYNLSSENRIFDVVILQLESNDNFTLPTQPCTRQHWTMLPNVVESFDTLNVGNWLCPVMNTQFKLQGKYSSDMLNYLQISLYPCSNDTDSSRPCASKQQINEFVGSDGDINFLYLYYVNSVINADQPLYKTYYLQDRNYISFNTKKGANMDLYITEIEINSDDSIWPFEENQKDSAISIPFAPIINPTEPSSVFFYAQFCIFKDYSTQTYQRKVQKLFVVFSFMGGLIGAIMTCLFMMNTYTGFAYELALAFQVFKEEKNCTTNKRQLYKVQFSILHFLKYICYFLAKKLKKNLKSPLYDHMDQCRNQILQQLDIKILIKRIIFLQYSISFIFEDYQLAEMHKEKPTLPHEIKKLRKTRRKIQSELPTEEDQLNYEDTKNKGLKPQIQKNQQKRMENQLQLPEFNNLNHIVFEDSRSMNESQVSNSLSPKIFFYNQGKKQTNKQENIKKLTDSAKENNIVSKKILRVIQTKNNKGTFQNQLERQRVQIS